MACGERGSGGANHFYIIRAGDEFGRLEFQRGGILEAGINGITNESLLAVVIDRLEGFQSGNFACRENAIALTRIQEALMWLNKRTADRLARGVEGKEEK
jgi:hypothetical protein